MKPSQGDKVKLTDKFITNSPFNWALSLKDTDLFISKLKMKTMYPCKIFTVFFIANNMIYKIDINDTGHFVDKTNKITNYMVFESFNNIQQVLTTPPSWTPNAPSQSFVPVTEEEANTNCPNCGSPALDLIISVKCTNPDCRSYR